MEQAYAQALWQMIVGGTPHDTAVRALRESLAAHGRVALLPRIGRAFARLAERESKKRDVFLTVAREEDVKHAEKEAHEAISALGVQKHDLKTRVDDTLIGGWRLEGRETLVDASYKKQLLDIYGRVTQA